MLDQYRKIYELLDPHERRRCAVLIVLILILGFVEVIGVASIMPFMAVVANPEVIESNALLSYAYNLLEFESANQFLVFLGSAVFVVLLFSLFFSAFAAWVAFRFIQMCNYRISGRLLRAYLRRPYVWFLNQHSADLGKTVLGEVNQVVNTVIYPAVNVLSRATVSLFLLALIVIIDPAVAITASLVIGGVYAVIFFSVQRYLVKIGAVMYSANSERFKLAQESLGGIKDVKVSGLESVYSDRYVVVARRFARSQANQLIVGDIPRYLLEAVAFGGMLGALLVLLMTRPGGLGEVLPLVTLYAFAGYRLLPALQQVYVNASALRFGSRVLDRLHSDLTDPVTVRALSRPDNEGTAEPLHLHRSIELADVSFRYPGGSGVALDRIKMKIDARTSVAFVGTTGAGKTTLVDVILGLLEPESGQLLVDGVAIDDSNRANWQRAVGYVPQSIFLVDDTLAANIAFGEKPDQIDMEAVERAARAARLHDFVVKQLDQGYLTQVGDRDIRLSGGQRQRIGIARALYRNPSVLVFDEATSALDNVTEREVMKAINELGHQKTILLIAHRLTTVRNCDCIHLMDQGRVVASGTYDQLMARSPKFREMAASDGPMVAGDDLAEAVNVR